MRKLTLMLMSCLLLLGIMACSDVVPICTAVEKPQDLTLYYSRPLEFTFKLSGDETIEQALYLETEITYYTPIGRNDLPLHFVVENLKNKQEFPKEFDVNIPLRVENQWQGKLDKNETDYTLTYIAIPNLKLKAGTYSMKVYANDNKSEKIYGIVKIAARLFEGSAAAPKA